MSAAPVPLPSEYEIAAQSLVRLFAREPGLLLAFERAIASHREMENRTHEIAHKGVAQLNTPKLRARAIRQILEALTSPRYEKHIDRESWERELAKIKDPVLVEKIRRRVESQIKTSEDPSYAIQSTDRRRQTP